MSSGQPLVNPGTILAGRWQIQDFIGSGETGEVYGVRDMHSTGSFALKLFWPNALAEPELWSAVQQTARTASGLGVDGVARTHDFGIDANSGRPFYVTERVAWSSLADRVRLRGPLTPADMASAFSVLSRALSAAHGIGLVHRDLKPENVFVAPENPNWVRISDFGVALLRAASPPPPGWSGTVGWVAPDAADPKARSTPAMDIYALGLVTFFALSGGPLHRAARVEPIDPGALWQELTAPLDSASLRARELGTAIDPAFDAWFQRAVSANPQTRFASVGEMASAFEAIARNLFAPQSPNAVALAGVAAAIAQPLIFQPESLPPVETRPAEPVASSLVQSAQHPEPNEPSPPSPKRNTAALFIGGAVICFALTAVGATALYRHHQSELSAESATPAVPPAPALSSTATSAPVPAPTTATSALASAAMPAPAPALEPAAHPAASGTASPPQAATASSTPPAKAPSGPSAQAPVVTPGPIAPKSIASAPRAAATNAKPGTTTTTAAASKTTPSTVAAPKKKCGSVFLPCK